jgi:hypothetical protein
MKHRSSRTVLARVTVAGLMALALSAAPMAAHASTTVAFGIRQAGAVVSWGQTYNFVHKGQKAVIYGSARPATAHLQLRLQSTSPGGTSWTTIASAITDAAGNTHVSITPSTTRDYRWAFPGSSAVHSGASATLRVSVVAALKAYANCTALNAVYAHGVGKVNANDHTTGTPVRNFLPSPAEYALNDGGTGQHDLDRDNDGIACEKK